MNIDKIDQEVASFNQKHLHIQEIRDVSNLKVPLQSIHRYKHSLLTPTNFLFVKGSYVESGLLVGDTKTLSLFRQLYLYLKYRYLVPVQKHTGTFLWYYDLWSTNYYHWICETLPRLFELYQAFPDKTIILPKQFSEISYIAESLQLLNMPVHWIDASISNTFEELITIQTNPAHADVNPVMQQKLINALKAENVLKPFRKIYISRDNAEYRKVKNEAALIQILKDYNFEIVHAEDLTLSAQIQLFHESACVIALHGAGLTNSVFMQPETTVIELRNHEWKAQPLCFWRLANILKLHWEYVLADAAEISSNADVWIDPEAFSSMLRSYHEDHK